MKFEVEQPAKDDLARLDAEEKQMQAQQRQMQERERLAEQAAHSATSRVNISQQTIGSSSTPASTGDSDPIIQFADQASNVKQLERTLNTVAQTKISLSKEERKSDKRFSEWQKECNSPNYVHTWSTTSDLTAASVCAWIARELTKSEGASSPQVEALSMRACSLSSGSGPCNSFGELYLERNNFKDALLVFDLPKCDSKYCLANASKDLQTAWSYDPPSRC